MALLMKKTATLFQNNKQCHRHFDIAWFNFDGAHLIFRCILVIIKMMNLLKIYISLNFLKSPRSRFIDLTYRSRTLTLALLNILT